MAEIPESVLIVGSGVFGRESAFPEPAAIAIEPILRP